MTMATQHTRRAVFRAEGSASIGHGHIRRCLSLARSLTTRGWDCSFYSPSTAPAVRAIVGGSVPVTEERPDRAEVVIADSYELTASDETDLRAIADVLLAVDDLPTRAHDCDLLLDATPGRSVNAYEGLVPGGCTMLVGPSFALLAPAFVQARSKSLQRRAARAKITRVLVSFGASDRTGVTGRVLDLLPSAHPNINFDVAVPSSFPGLAALREVTRTSMNVALHVDGDIAKLMSTADLAVGAGGVTSLERCCLGLPSIVVVTADNQEDVARGLDGAHAAVVVRGVDELLEERVAREFLRLAEDPSRLSAMSEAASQLCDGLGSDRVAEVLLQAAIRAEGS